jgi:hypothetical protein
MTTTPLTANHSAREALLERLTISELVQSWALHRDAGHWAQLRETVHADGIMTATWFEGTFEAFITGMQAAWRRGSKSQHFQGGTVVEVVGRKAIAQTRMSILVRGSLEGVAVDVNCIGVFYDRVEIRDGDGDGCGDRGGQWRIAKRNVIYDKDSMSPVHPGDVIELSPQKLSSFPEGYRHLAYLQSTNGAHVNPNLPTAQGDARDQLIRDAQSWLRTTP